MPNIYIIDLILEFDLILEKITGKDRMPNIVSMTMHIEEEEEAFYIRVPMGAARFGLIGWI